MKHQHTILTGATGTLGLELLPRLIRSNPRQKITLLLRGKSSAGFRQRCARIRQSLQTYWPEIELSSVRPVRGDLTEPNLGLSMFTYRALQNQATQIIHSAALTQLNPPWNRAREINVGGTRKLIEFAIGCPHLEQFAYISTAFVAGDRMGNITEDELLCGQNFLNTYQRSKCAAELLVRTAKDRLPITIFRPSIIVGDSTDGHLAVLDNIYLPLAHIALGQLREIPGSGQARLDLVPVDYVAEAMVRLLQSQTCCGKTYHLTAGPGLAVTARTLVETAIYCAGRDYLNKPRFAEDLFPEGTGGKNPKLEDPQLHRLAVFFAHLGLRQKFDDTNTRRDLGCLATWCPRPENYLPNVFAFCRSTQWGKELTWATPRSYTGEEENHERAS